MAIAPDQSVLLERPDEALTGRKETPVLAIMFVDAVNSTGFAEQFGEIEAENRRIEQFRVMRDIVEAAEKGKFVKSLGDGFMAVFPDPSKAVVRAVRLQRKIAALGLGPIRVGIHLGQVALDHFMSEDVYGRHVNRAARVCSLAHPGQILVTQPVYDNASGWLHPSDSPVVGWHCHGEFRLKGISDAIDIYEVLYKGHERPQPLDGGGVDSARVPLVIVPIDKLAGEYHGVPHLTLLQLPAPRKAIILDAPLLTVGRGPENRLAIRDLKVSRFHAALARIGELWLIIDHGSRNGTTVNDRPVEQHILADGDRIRIGPECYIFQGGQAERHRPERGLYALAISQRARACRGLVMGDALETLSEEAMSNFETLVPPRALAMTCCDGPARGGTHMFSSPEPMILGRGADVDLLLEDPDLCDEHLSLRLVDGLHLELAVLNGSPLPWVNGERVKSAVLTLGDVISVGRSQLLVHMPI